MKLKYLVVAMTAAMSVMAAAEEKTDGAAEEIVVTGMRKSLESSVQIKKNTMEIVDSITAEDVGKLPDPNVAETLTRIPGVQGYRYGGEGASPFGQGSGMTVRGLTGQTASRLDGRAYFTAGSAEFNIEGAIPGMIAGIDVYKNPSAEHIEGGIGGLIDIKTRKPLDFDKRTVSVAVSSRYNQDTGDASPDVFGLYADQFDVGDGKLGVILAANYQESHNRSDSDTIFARGVQARRAVRADTTEYTTLSGANQAYAGRSDIWHLADVTCPGGGNFEANPACLAESERQKLISTLGQTKQVFEEDINRVRKGLNASVEWRPNDSLELYATGNYNYFLYKQDYRFMVFNDSRTVQNLKTTSYKFDEAFMNKNVNGGNNELVTGQRLDSGTFKNSSLEIWGGNEDHPYETWMMAVGGKWQASDKLEVKFDVSTINADQDKDNRRVDIVPINGLTWDITRSLLSDPHGLSISGPDLSKPSNFVFRNYNNGNNEHWNDDGIAVKVDLKYELDTPLFTDIKVGGRYATHNANYANFSYNNKPLTTDGKGLAADKSNGILVSSLSGLVETSRTDWLEGDAGYSGGFLVVKPSLLGGDNIRNLFSMAGIPADYALPENVLNRSHSEEKNTAGYAVGDFAYGDIIKGNIGVRVVQTDLYARAMVTNQAGSIVPNEADASYVNVLPSFNITGYLDDEQSTLLRFGFAKGITRPSLGDLNPTIYVNQNTGEGSGGNPQLRPFKADSYDISLEKYFSKSNYVSAAVFYKGLDGFFNGVSTCESVAAFPVYSGTSANGCAANQYKITRNVNANEGSAKGVELAAQTFFDYDFMPAALHNFGVSTSYTYLKTVNPVKQNGVFVDTPMPFQSKNNFSISGMYEGDVMSARVVYTYRSDFVLFGVDAWPSWGRYVKGYGILDASMSFKLVDNLQLSVNASNITNKAPDRYAGEPGAYTSDFSVQHFTNGRILGLGLRYSY